MLLAALYAEVITPVWRVTQAELIVCDQFSQRADRLDKAFREAGLPKPQQMHHAETTSTAVAAASILASAQFTAGLATLGHSAGLGSALPRGASAARELEQTAHAIMRRVGSEGMAHYAKLNFRPIRALLGLPDVEA